MNTETKEIARIIPKKLIAFALNCLDSVASLFISLRIGPNALSVLALAAGMAAGALFIFERPLLAGIMIFVCGIFDILDGKVAEGINKKSRSQQRTAFFEVLYLNTILCCQVVTIITLIMTTEMVIV